MIEVAPAYETNVETKLCLWCIPTQNSPDRYYCLPQTDSHQSVGTLNVFPSHASAKEDEYSNLMLYISNNEPFVGTESRVNCRLQIARIQEPPTRPSVPKDLSDLERSFLQKSPLIESEDKGIQSISRTITEGCTDSFEAIVRIVSWVFSNIRFQNAGSESLPSAKWILQHRIGTCGDLSRLATALIRAYGLPARIVAGTLASPVGMTDHGWGEFYFPEIGWIPFEPTLGYVGWIDANHVKVAALPDETSMKSWFKASADCMSRQVEPPRLVSLKDAYLQDSTTGKRQLILTLQNEADYYISTRVIVTKDQAIFRDGKIDAPYDNLTCLEPKSSKEISLTLNVSSAKITLIINLFLGAYYKLELQEDNIQLCEVPKEEYTCSRCYDWVVPKHKPPWKKSV